MNQIDSRPASIAELSSILEDKSKLETVNTVDLGMLILDLDKALEIINNLNIDTKKVLSFSLKFNLLAPEINLDTWQKSITRLIELDNLKFELEFPLILKIDIDKLGTNSKIDLIYSNELETPGYRNLRKLQKRMRGYDCQRQIFSTKIKTMQDLQVLSRLLISRKKEDKVSIRPIIRKGFSLTNPEVEFIFNSLGSL